MNDSAAIKSLFLLDPSVTFLNFGSFGACPRPVFEVYQSYQRELEAEPVRFVTVNGPQYVAKSRNALAGFIGCNGDDLVFTTNPTYAINIIARGLKLEPGDEVLATDLEYGAMDRTWNFYCREKGAVYVRQPITLPVTTKERFVEEFFKGATAKTKAVFISQITSATALILPVEEICEEAKRRGYITIVDGAHVPAHIPLNLRELKADIYTGTCHKWMMTPKGSSFLYVKKEMQDSFEPLVISWGYESDTPSGSLFQDYHQFNGTRDFSAFLTIPAAIEFMEKHHWKAVAETCRTMVIQNAKRFAELLGTELLCPPGEEWLGQMCSIPIRCKDPVKLHHRLFDEFRIEIPVMKHNGNVYIRYSINGFNSQDDLDKLYHTLGSIDY
jgi:isopenicillin-N epimerase